MVQTSAEHLSGEDWAAQESWCGSSLMACYFAAADCKLCSKMLYPFRCTSCGSRQPVSWSVSMQQRWLGTAAYCLSCSCSASSSGQPARSGQAVASHQEPALHPVRSLHRLQPQCLVALHRASGQLRQHARVAGFGVSQSQAIPRLSHMRGPEAVLLHFPVQTAP